MFKKFLFGLLMIGLAGVPLRAQFNSGSTEADGALSPTANTTLTCPEPDCVFNFTTINIPTGVTVRFNPNAANTPVTLLASGDVVITGTIDVNGAIGIPNGSGGLGGPGGFRGGDGTRGPSGAAALGPGAGLPLGNAGGGGSFATLGAGSTNPVYGTPLLLPLIGGSGGAGGAIFGSLTGNGGGGGGGALLIASSATLTVDGAALPAIAAKGGNTGGNPSAWDGGGGSGGAIRLIANAIMGSGLISVLGGSAANNGGAGRIRVESGAPIPGTLRFEPTGITSTQQFSPGMPPLVVLPNLPSILITTVDGMAVPNPPGGQFGRIDVNLTSTGTKTVQLAASGVPLGTTVSVSVAPETGAQAPTSVMSTPLSGTINSSTATANVNLPTFGAYFIQARATFNVPSGALESMKFGGEKVKQMRIETAYGTGSKVFYILESGKEIPAEKMQLASNTARGK